MSPFFSALRHLAIDGYEFLFALIGTGSAEKHIHEVIKAHGLSQVVTVIPGMQPLRELFAGADIYIRPQPTNEFNSYLMEAMSVGMAVAACRGGIDDLLIEDRTAVLFDPDDELRIYAAIQKLLDQKEFARRLALSAQIHLRKNHSVSRMVDTLLQTYRNAQDWYKNQKTITETV